MKAKVKFKKKNYFLNFILSKTASVRGVSGRYVIAQWFKEVNSIGGVMVRVLTSSEVDSGFQPLASSEVDCAFQSLVGQTRDY